MSFNSFGLEPARGDKVVNVKNALLQKFNTRQIWVEYDPRGAEGGTFRVTLRKSDNEYYYVDTSALIWDILTVDQIVEAVSVGGQKVNA